MSKDKPQPEFEFPTVIVPQGNGAFLLKPGKPVPKEKLITTAEAAKILRCSEDSVHRYRSEALLTGHQIAPRYRVSWERAEVEALAARNDNTPDDGEDQDELPL